MKKDVQLLKEVALSIRKSILKLIFKTKSPHIGSSFSVVEILVALYFKILNICPDLPIDDERDRFILSKGHACPALYAVLHKRGFLKDDDMLGFAVDGGVLEQHPRRELEHGIEISTGSLGHGLSIGSGMALSSRVNKNNYKVYVLMSDGELNEGSVWESIMFSAHHKLHNLVALVDYNKMQALGDSKDIIDMDPICEKWESFGWFAQKIDGHNFNEILEALNSLSLEKPNVVILHTIKGKGVSFMENVLLWHYRTPDEKEYNKAIKELV